MAAANIDFHMTVSPGASRFVVAQVLFQSPATIGKGCRHVHRLGAGTGIPQEGGRVPLEFSSGLRGCGALHAELGVSSADAGAVPP
jgi:hypothetical protein